MYIKSKVNMDFPNIVGKYDVFLREYRQSIFTNSFYQKRLYRTLLRLYQQLDEDEIKKVIEYGLYNDFNFGKFGMTYSFERMTNELGVLIFLVQIQDLKVINLWIDIKDSGREFRESRYCIRVRLYRSVYSDESNLKIISKLKAGNYKDLVSEKRWKHISECGILEHIILE